MKERKYLLAKEKSNTKTYVVGFIVIVVFVVLFSFSGSGTEQNANINTNNNDATATTQEFMIKSINYEPENPATADSVNITVTLENNDSGNADYTLIMKYGDTGATGVSGISNGQKTHTFNHVYTEKGTYIIKASLKINDETKSEITKQITIF